MRGFAQIFVGSLLCVAVAALHTEHVKPHEPGSSRKLMWFAPTAVISTLGDFAFA